MGLALTLVVHWPLCDGGHSTLMWCERNVSNSILSAAPPCTPMYAEQDVQNLCWWSQCCMADHSHQLLPAGATTAAWCRVCCRQVVLLWCWWQYSQLLRPGESRWSTGMYTGRQPVLQLLAACKRFASCSWLSGPVLLCC